MGSPASIIAARAALSNPYLLEPARLSQFADGSYDENGEFQPGSRSNADIRLVSAAVNARERATLPEGFRESELRKFWFRGTPRPVKEGASGGDIVEYNNREYRAIQVHEWGGFVEVVGAYTGEEVVPVVPGRDYSATDYSMEDYG